MQGRPHAPANDSPMRSLLDLGKRSHQAGRLQEAEQAYRDALNLAPDHPETLHYLGLLLYRLGRLDEAVELVEQGLQARAWPRTLLVQFRRGRSTGRPVG